MKHSLILLSVFILFITSCAKDIQTEVSADFPYESKYIDILDSSMHYIEEGEGDPILFLHGNPTSSYLWRNIIPYVSPVGRAIAVDLIGMGKSGKPDIQYDYFDHYRYLDAFIKEMDLTNITLVLHDWGSGLGFHYAAQNPDNIKGIAFMESLWRPFDWKRDFSFIMRIMFKKFRNPEKGDKLIIDKNMFVEKMIPGMVIRKLSEEEMSHYRAPYLQKEHRKPVAQWPREIPINGDPKGVDEVVNNYHNFLKTTEIPKLLIWSKPGVIIQEDSIELIKKDLPNIKAVYVGHGKHYLQEDNPDRIGAELFTWIEGL